MAENSEKVEIQKSEKADKNMLVVDTVNYTMPASVYYLICLQTKKQTAIYQQEKFLYYTHSKTLNRKVGILNHLTNHM